MVMAKYAMVTGAASGLGSIFSRLLAEDSYSLILICKHNDKLELTRKDLENKYAVEVEIIDCDLSKPGIVDDIFQKLRNKPIDVLINNAGYGFYGFFNKTDWKIEEEMINLHVMNLTYLTKLILAKMTGQGSGRIMNVSSVAAFLPGPLMAVYYATKAYILSFTLALSNEVKGTGVSVTAFCPGQTKTNFQKTVADLSGSKISSTGIIMADAEKVARYGYKAMMAGKPLAVPGIMNKAILQALRITPRKTALLFVRKMQEKIRR
jgi:short-subunit dehydrogenase